MLVAVLVGAGLAVTVPTAASAEDLVARCDQFGWWQWSDIGNNKRMGSCHYGTNQDGRRYWMVTRTISTDFWFGYHGCVYANFYSPGGTLLMTSSVQRYGVSAEHSRQDFWNGVPPMTPSGQPVSWQVSFVHYRC